MNHIVGASPFGPILANCDESPTSEEECHVMIRALVFRREAGTLRKDVIVQVALNPAGKRHHCLVQGLY